MMKIMKKKKNIWAASLGLALLIVFASGCSIESDGTGKSNVKELHGQVDLDVGQLKKDWDKLNQPVGEIHVDKAPVK
ncbi:hypothetical protein [Paenibacillus aestuarii]|uniref:Uncharacterized protein n=1 Tax=Paenibacillus aestuarii TaxID=516965 RepID=A0ABW0KAC0_9BACL|nr:hypothetical protein [Paenibacillus aestuarii]